MTPAPRSVLVIALALGLVAPIARAQFDAATVTTNPAPPPAGAKVMAVTDVKINSALVAATKDAGKLASLDRVAEAMDGQLIDRFHNTRRFKIIARSDLDSLLKEQGFAASGNVDTADALAAQSFKIKGVQYILVTTLDDFQDFTEEAVFGTLNEKVTKRVIRLSAVGKLYDSTTGELLESTNLQVTGKDFAEKRLNHATDGNLTDAQLLKTARQMAEQMAQRVTDVLYPARVVAVTANQVTINRGDGGGANVGDIWIVHRLGEVLTDPDTGEVMRTPAGVPIREEIELAKVRITSVQPQTSKGEIIEGQGVNRGDLLRKLQPANP